MFGIQSISLYNQAYAQYSGNVYVYKCNCLYAFHTTENVLEHKESAYWKQFDRN